MATCSGCGTTMFGGVKDGDRRYCNEKCRRADVVGRVGAGVPDEPIDALAQRVHAGPCPHCNGPGPVDVHMTHHVLSFLVMTRWNSRGHIACRSCGRKKQAGALAISLFGGWWGFPWGLILTPVQVGRNLVGMLGGPDAATPSPALREHARNLIAAQLAQQTPPPLAGARGFEVVIPATDGVPLATAHPVATADQR